MANMFDPNQPQKKPQDPQQPDQNMFGPGPAGGNLFAPQAPAPSPVGGGNMFGGDVTPLPGEVDDISPTSRRIPNLPPGVDQTMNRPGIPSTPPVLESAQGPGLVPNTAPVAGEGSNSGAFVTLPSGAQVPRSHPDAIAAGMGDSAAPAPGGAPAPGQPPTTVKGAFQSALLAKLNSDPNDVSTKSAEIAGAVQAGRLSDQRGAERARQIARERQVAQGITGGGAQTELDGIEQQRGESAAMRESGLVGDLAKRKEAALLQTLALAGNQLSGEETRALQERLGMLDATIRREGIAQQGQLGGRDLDLRDKLGSGNLNLGLLGLLSGREQFGQQLGLQAGIAGANLNQQALLSLLGGL
jgi:hypothetical protein